jgi:hypothetical protein
MLTDNITPNGHLTLTLRDENGKVKMVHFCKNIVVDTGKAFIASRLIGTQTAMSHIAVGTGTIAQLATDTTLQTELARVVFDSSPTTNAKTITFVVTFPAGVATGNLTEAGIFNAASAGTMLARTTFAPFPKTALDSLTIEWDVTIN